MTEMTEQSVGYCSFTARLCRPEANVAGWWKSLDPTTASNRKKENQVSPNIKSAAI